MTLPDESLRAKLHRAVDRACEQRSVEEREAIVEAALVTVHGSRDSGDGADLPSASSSWERAFHATAETLARMGEDEGEIDRDLLPRYWAAARGELAGKQMAALADRSAADPMLREIRRVAMVFAEHAAADEEVTVDAIPIYARAELSAASASASRVRMPWAAIAIAITLAAALALFLTR